MTDASIIIVYHYIQRKEERPRMKGMLVDDFERHVKLLLESGYRIVTLHEYLEATKDLTTLPPSKMAVLSFDDGLKVHIENVMPLFQKYGLKGSFFVITRPLTDRWLAPVHKNHLLLAASVEEDSLFSVADLITEATRWLVKNSGVAAPLNTEDLIKKYAAMSPWDDQTTAYYKYLLNVFVSEPVRSLLIDHLFRAFYGELSAWVSKFYLDKEDIQQMQRAGMEIGSHSHTHQFLSSLSEEAQREEIVRSKIILEEILGEMSTSFSYPYGLGGAYDQVAMDIAKTCGFRAALTCEKGYAAASPSLLAINRIDANDMQKYLIT